MRPAGITDMEVSSFMKKFKDKKFAAKCNREVIKHNLYNKTGRFKYIKNTKVMLILILSHNYSLNHLFPASVRQNYAGNKCLTK